MELWTVDDVPDGGGLAGYCLGRMGVASIPLRIRKPVTPRPGIEHVPDIAAELGFNEHPADVTQPGKLEQQVGVLRTARSLREHYAAQNEFKRNR